jgi:hypothetical protein
MNFGPLIHFHVFTTYEPLREKTLGYMSLSKPDQKLSSIGTPLKPPHKCGDVGMEDTEMGRHKEAWTGDEWRDRSCIHWVRAGAYPANTSLSGQYVADLEVECGLQSK